MKKIIFFFALIGIIVPFFLYAGETELLLSAFTSGYVRNDSQSSTLHSIIGQDFAMPIQSADKTLTSGFLPSLNPLISKVIPSTAQNIPLSFQLFQNYPNPFNPETRICYNISMATDVRLEIFNVQGQSVRVLVNEMKSPGRYSIVWDGRDEQGLQLPSGVYLFQLKCNAFKQAKQLTFVK